MFGARYRPSIEFPRVDPVLHPTTLRNLIIKDNASINEKSNAREPPREDKWARRNRATAAVTIILLNIVLPSFFLKPTSKIEENLKKQVVNLTISGFSPRLRSFVFAIFHLSRSLILLTGSARHHTVIT